MKRSKTSSRKALSGDRQLFARPSNQVRRRAATFKLESLEERTLLSVSPTGTAASPQAVMNLTNAAVPSQSPGTSVDDLASVSTSEFTIDGNSAPGVTVLEATSTISGLQPVLPLGSLVYQSTVDNVLLSSTDIDTYNLAIDPQQTLAVIVTPLTSSLTATVDLYSPTGKLIGAATSPSPGAPAVLYGVQSSKGGTYQFTVSGGPGEYTIQPILNAYVDPAAYGGAPNNSIATATPIDPYGNSFIGQDNRTAVLGSTGSPATFGDALVVEKNDVILIDHATGAVLQHYTSPAFAGLILFDVAIAPDNTFYVLGDQNDYTGVIVHMNLAGQTLGTITSPVTDSPGYLSPEGFGLDPTNGSFWIPLRNSGQLIHLDSHGNLLGEYSGVGSNPDDAAVGPDGNIYISLVSSSEIETLDPSSGSLSYFASSPFPLDLTWSVAGDLWVGDIDGGAEQFNSSGALIQSISGSGVTAAEPALSGNIWDTNIFSAQVNQYDSSGNLLTQTSCSPEQPGLGIFGDVPGEAPFAPPSSPVYSFALNQGESATIALQSLNGENGAFTLYDDQGDVLGLSSPDAANYTAGLNNFVAPNDGTYYVQVTGDPGLQFNLVVTRGADFTTQDHTSPGDAQAITATQQSGDPKEGGALGYISSGPSTDYYSVNANAGDNLHFATSTPAGGPNEFVNNFYPELLLYDPNGNLVAIASGNAADGRNSVIDYTVPEGDAGKWVIEVTQSPDTETPTSGEYGLLVTGATGALSPFVVTATTPASGAIVQPPTDIIVTFNDPVLGTSLTPGELEVNGVAATAVSLVNANTVDWSVPSSAYATGIDLANIVTIGADSSGNQVTDVSGQTLTPYSYTFYTTNVAPYIVSSSIDGSVFSPAPANVTEVVTFSQPMDPSFTTASSFDLLGNYRNVQYAAASYSWDPTDTILTINYTNLPDDTYTLTLYASGFENSAGIPLGSNYVANFAVALGTAAFPTPLTPVAPLGDLIYTGTDSHVLATSTDVDYLTLALNAGETLSLIGTPTGSAQQLVITVLDPDNNVVATATAAGANAVLETAAVGTTGTYTIQISDAAGNLGLYSIEAYLNTALKTGVPDSIAAAQDISGSSYVLGEGNSDRLAVLGSIVGGPSFGDALVVESSGVEGGSVALINQNSGHIVADFTSPAFANLYLFDIAIAPDNTFYVLGDQNGFTGVIVHMNLQGDTLGEITVPVTDSSGNLSPEGFGLDPRDGSFWVPLLNSATLVHIDSSGNLLGEYSVPSYPDDAAVGPDGLIYISQVFSGQITAFNPATGTSTTFAISPFPLDLTWSVAGDLWVGDIEAGAEEFDGSGNLILSISGSDVTAAEPALSGNIWDAAIGTKTVSQYSPSFVLLTSTPVALFQPGLAVLGDVPNEAPLPVPDNDDYYSFQLSEGQSATIVVDSLNSKAVQISLLDADGDVLATGVSGSTNVSQYIQNFVTPADGTYYVDVTGDPGVQYSLTVTRSANFDIEPNNTIRTAQSLTGTNGVLGAIDPDSPSLPPAVNNDWYSINVGAGNALSLQTYTPSDQGGQFINNVSVNLELYDTYGNRVAIGTPTGDGRNEVLLFNAPVTGTYYIHVFNNPGNSGEYYLSVETARYQAGDISGQVYNDLNGSGAPASGDPGLDNWEVDVFDSNNNFVASQFTSGGGYFDIGGLAPGTYTISEILQSGWTQTQPAAPYTYTVTVTAGATASGNDFGNFQNVTISGEKFNDLTGIGAFMPGDPGLPDWTIDLVDQNGNIVATTVTDQNGDYSFTDLGPGTYTVEEELQPGWIQTFPAPPGTYMVTATSGSDQTGLLFGNFQLVTFSGTVYNDLNGNGVLDPGDPGLEGWTVELLDSSGNIVAATTSAEDGTYSFSDVGPGTYTIEEVNQTGWYQTEPVNPPGTYTEQAISSTNPSGLDFGNFQLVNVTGEVYNDLNGNGNLDPGEPGLQGWTVLLLNPAGNTVASTTSDQNGDYQFDNLFPGTFTVEEILQAGWIQTQPVNPNYYQFTTQSGLNETGLNFGNFINSEDISGTVYNDLNGSGMIAPGDPGLQGWTINVLNSGGTVVASTTSASDGTYSFSDLTVQQYTIEEITQTGWIITQPTNPPGTYTLPADSGQYTDLNFGNFQLVSVSGNVYNDLNGNGNQDPGEPGLKNWTVDVLNARGTVVASAVSNAQGNYTIPNIGPGSYTVAEVVQSGWIQTQPLNPTYYSITTSSGTNIAGETFGNFKAVSVSGNVYNDLNGNGLHDAGEPGLSKWTVLLENSSGTVIASVKSDVNGNYTFTGVGGGTYEVAEVVQTNWVQTQPLYPTVYSFTTKSGTNLPARNFGDHYSPALSPSAVIDNGQPGYSETGSWSTVVGGFNGTNRVAKTVHAGGTKATWNFSGISPATYEVYVTFAGKSGYSSAAPYTVYNGRTKLGTVDINQSILVTQSQGGHTQGSYGGVGWLELGIFAISSKDLQVVLSNQASGNFVDADGVLLVPQGGAGVHGGSGPATVVDPNSAVGANSTNSLVSIGTLNFDSTAPSTNGNGQQSQVISLSGVSHAALSVIYNQGSQPVVNQSLPSLVDAVIGLGTSNSNGSSSNDAITALAQSLISGKNNS